MVSRLLFLSIGKTDLLVSVLIMTFKSIILIEKHQVHKKKLSGAGGEKGMKKTNFRILTRNSRV